MIDEATKFCNKKTWNQNLKRLVALVIFRLFNFQVTKSLNGRIINTKNGQVRNELAYWGLRTHEFVKNLTVWALIPKRLLPLRLAHTIEVKLVPIELLIGIDLNRF